MPDLFSKGPSADRIRWWAWLSQRKADKLDPTVDDPRSDYDFLDAERVKYTGPDRFVEIAGERIDLNDVPDIFTQTCSCGRPSASPPAEVYCVECATGGR